MSLGKSKAKVYVEKSTGVTFDDVAGIDEARARVSQQRKRTADVVVRSHPATFPLETKAAEPFHVLYWLRQRGIPSASGMAGKDGGMQCGSVAVKLDAAATQRAKRRACRKAHKAGRTITAPTLAVEEWVWRITTRQAQFPREG